MDIDDAMKKKKFIGVYATYLPLPTDGQVVMKYRVDSKKDALWTTIFTETTDGETRTEALYDANKLQLKDFTNVEFLLESTEGAIITGFGYKYDILKSQL